MPHKNFKSKQNFEAVFNIELKSCFTPARTGISVRRPRIFYALPIKEVCVKDIGIIAGGLGFNYRDSQIGQSRQRLATAAKSLSCPGAKPRR